MADEVKKAPPELLAVSRAYDLAREISTRVAKYPRSHHPSPEA